MRVEPSAGLQALFDEGKAVGKLARELFPGGEEILYEEGTLKKKIIHTKDLIHKGVETIYEASFSHDNVMAIVDILHKGDDGWELYEVKSSTGVKDLHIYDIAIQCRVLKGCGINLSKACLVHINSDYVRQGDIDVHQLFRIADLTENIASAMEVVESELARQREMLASGLTTLIDIGPHCNEPYECEFIPHCWAHIPENSIFQLRGRGIDKFAYYRLGVIRFEDIDLKGLNKDQRMQVEAELYDREYIDRDSIKAFLHKLYYPLAFLDFETLYNEAIPPFDNTSPYCRIPFQFSIYALNSPHDDLDHNEFLAESGHDGREELARMLVELIPENACVITYNMQFEKGIIKDLAALFPQYSEKLMAIYDNVADLMEPFKNRFYYSKALKGSYSLKYVLPALVPDLGYSGMAVANGEDAVIAYKGLAGKEDKEERALIIKDLLEYCKLDTLAMVKILEKLRSLTKT
ncbi:MAG: DUF2779 domain-containing protein [Deltaproteobacteria bacterium]|nr:DUF2779 domain-containing protein [Deltaproteobacteria bacterium]